MMAIVVVCGLVCGIIITGTIKSVAERKFNDLMNKGIRGKFPDED